MKKELFLSDIDLGAGEIREVQKVLKSRWLSQGKYTQAFEEAFSRYVGVTHAFAVSSCTAALHLALRALGIQKGDEVLVPSLTFVATVNSVLYAQGTPVFCDITGNGNLNVSPSDMERKITKKTKAVIVMHYAGYACDMKAVRRLARKHNLYVIEDAAHAVGSEYGKKKLGAWSDAACFSFFSNKNLVTGEGGMIVTPHRALSQKIKLLRSHGMTTSSWDRYKGHSFTYDVVETGYNYRFDEMRAAIGLVQLKKLDRNNRKRAALTSVYREELRDAPGLTLPFLNFPYPSACHIFSVILDSNIDRSFFMQFLKSKGIQTSIHYRPVHTFSHYKKQFKNVTLTLTEDMGRRLVTLPLHPLMEANDARRVAGAVREALSKVRK